MSKEAFIAATTSLYRSASALRECNDPLLWGQVEGILGRLSTLVAAVGGTAMDETASKPSVLSVGFHFPSLRLDGKVAIVTGGSGGLGALAAAAFAGAGADVVVVARNLDKCNDTAARVRAAGRRALAMRVDVLSADQLSAMVESVRAEFGKVDILFNNAGITSPKTMLESDAQEWFDVVDLNIKGTFLCTKAVVPLMAEQGGGRIINMGSILSRVGMANRSAYATSKAGIAAMTKSLAFEFGPVGITVNAICPTVIVTDLNRGLIERQPKLYEAVINRTALGRLGQPEDIAGALVFLASPAAAFITGQMLFVDGGYTAG